MADSHSPQTLSLPGLRDGVLPGERLVLHSVGLTLAAVAVLAIAGAVAASLISVNITVGAQGTLEPTDVWPVRAPSDGMVASVLVSAGDTVRAGQPMVQLDVERSAGTVRDLQLAEEAKRLERERLVLSSIVDSAAQAELERDGAVRLVRARAALIGRMAEYSVGANVDSLLRVYVPGHHVELDLAVAEVRVAESLAHPAAGRERGLLRSNAIETQESELRRLAEARRLEEAHLRRATVRAEVGGVVLADGLDRLVGSAVRAGDPILDVVRSASWKATLLVSERDVRDVAVGQRGELEVPALETGDARQLQCVVTEVSQQPVHADGTAGPARTAGPAFYRVTVSVAGGATEVIALRRGFSASARIRVRRERISRAIVDHVLGGLAAR